ncbi:MAG: hypothetical protein U0R69_07435 [Gaiellales bacterium]
MEIGEPRRVITIEPIEDPIPRRDPDPPREPEPPVKAAPEPEKVAP